MSPEPNQLGRGSLEELAVILQPAESLIPTLNRWIEAAGEKVGGRSTLTGFILDGECIHPVVRIESGLKRGLFALGGTECGTLFLLKEITGKKKDHFFSVNWGGISGRREYPVSTDGFILGEKTLELVKGNYSGHPSGFGAVLFPPAIASEVLNTNKILSLFPYSKGIEEQKKRAVSAFLCGLRRAAGSLR